MKNQKPLVGVIMGSKSDAETMRAACETLARLRIPHEERVVSAHRTPDLMASYAKEARGRGLRVIIAGAGGAAHLPGMVAAQTELPVLGVPVPGRALNGLDSLLSIVQMPAGIPVGTLAIGTAGATNAALLAAAILALENEKIRAALTAYRAAQTSGVQGKAAARRAACTAQAAVSASWAAGNSGACSPSPHAASATACTFTRPAAVPRPARWPPRR